MRSESNEAIEEAKFRFGIKKVSIKNELNEKPEFKLNLKNSEVKTNNQVKTKNTLSTATKIPGLVKNEKILPRKSIELNNTQIRIPQAQ
jgi:hypothetical protein